MKKVLLGLFCVYSLLFWLFIKPMIIYTEEVKTIEYEPLNAQMLMDKIVVETETIHEEEHSISYEDAQILMRIAMAEAESDGVEGKAMVMAVVLNRVNDERFPNTIKEVVFQKYQFSPIADGRYYTVEPDVECNLALAEIEKGTYSDIEALYFENATSSWQSENCEYLYKVGHHRFYK